MLTTARFESAVTFTIDEHLTQNGANVLPSKDAAAGGRPSGSKSSRHAGLRVVRYAVRSVPVTLLRTEHNNEARPDRAEAAQYLNLFDNL